MTAPTADAHALDFATVVAMHGELRTEARRIRAYAAHDVPEAADAERGRAAEMDYRAAVLRDLLRALGAPVHIPAEGQLALIGLGER